MSLTMPKVLPNVQVHWGGEKEQNTTLLFSPLVILGMLTTNKWGGKKLNVVIILKLMQITLEC